MVDISLFRSIERWQSLQQSMRIRATLESMSADNREAWAEELGQLASSPADEDGQNTTDGTYEEGTADSTPQDFI